ncbi:MAG TPA: winged helix-turn-helix domain-containing protein [Verrucomicrobiae bacterium]|nr:winged helix-turn-helix domain-containing protein [Verrucomicrobiae bacterium]
MIRRGKCHLPEIVLDRDSGTPLHRQIHTQIGQAVRGGRIPNGARLPSTRVLAKLLRVSRNTILTAYDDLAADNLLRPQRGSGMRVCQGAAPAMSLHGLSQVIREAGYPARVLAIEDSDGNSLYLRI